MRDVLHLPGINPVDIDIQGKSVVVEAVVVAVTRLPECPTCRKPMVRHGKRKPVYADLPMEEQPVRIAIKIPRFYCENCGGTLYLELPFLDTKRRATRRLLDSVRLQCFSKPFHRLAAETGLAVNTIKNIAQDLIDDLDRTVKSTTPTIIGMAELSLAGSKHLAIFNLATQTVIDILHKAGWKASKPYFKSLPNRDLVEWVCAGPTKSTKDDLLPYFPNAAFLDDQGNVQAPTTGGFQERLQKSLETATEGIQKVAEHFGRGYSFEILRAKILYAKQAREAVRSITGTEKAPGAIPVDTSGLNPDSNPISVSSKMIDYGAHIPTLVEMAGSGEFD